MKEKPVYSNSEPVPTASQLAALPFVAAVEGFLRQCDQSSKLRVTLHRVMTRQDVTYLQQLCPYLGPNDPKWQEKVGRVFAVDHKLVGAAFRTKSIWATKHYGDVKSLREDLRLDMQQRNEKGSAEDMPVAYIAIPFLAANSEPVLILYAESNELNTFSDQTRVRSLCAMSEGFCRLFDRVQTESFAGLRNFPLQVGSLDTGGKEQYPRLQEQVRYADAPRFRAVVSFNFEA